jgi:NADH dehydrogenase FAD-containing subunit
MKTNMPRQKTVILGGGYAGVMCANRPAGTVGDRVSITLVNPIKDFARTDAVAPYPQESRHAG